MKTKLIKKYPYLLIFVKLCFFIIEKLRYPIIILILFIFPALALSQHLSTIRNKNLYLTNDSIHIDTLSIIPGTFTLYNTQNQLIRDTVNWRLVYPEAVLITTSEFRAQHPEVKIIYRVFNISFGELSRHKSIDTLKKYNLLSEDRYLYKPLATTDDLFGISHMSSSGSISRGISVGNNQDASVNSSLNLQFAGKLTENLSIRAAITDNNIPVQPEGTTQQIQEFDKVYIQIYNDNFQLTAGDFEIKNPAAYFMRFSKKAQGAICDIKNNNGAEKNKLQLTTTTAAALSKGRFSRNIITAVEGNQGPYKLKGDNNEMFIIVLAGTERVYVDGKLLQRGQDADYIIDYNTAEIVFMPKNLITKDKRIIVEFEYSDKNYARSMFYTANMLKTERLELQFNFFSEQDIKSQPQNQELTPEQKLLMSMIGDSTHLAVTAHIDSMPFSTEFIMYKMIDTVVGGVVFDSVFVYSINPDSAHYRLGFSNVGANNGNYIQELNAANGRVFKWVAPLNGMKQGTYEPIILLITPKKQQLFTSRISYKLTNTTTTYAELAVSNNDANTFSKLHQKDNTGLALKSGVEHIQKINSDTLHVWKLKSSLWHEWTQNTFKPLERYRDAEFERQWNIIAVAPSDEHYSVFNLQCFDNKNNNISYTAGSYFKPSLYKGFQNSINTALKSKYLFFMLDAALTNTNDTALRTSFWRHKATTGTHFRWFTLGVKNEFEKNQFILETNDSLQLQSFNFEQYEIFIQNADTLKQLFTAFYRFRNDFHPSNNQFVFSSKADEYGLSATLNKLSTQRLNIYTAYRKLYRLSNYIIQQGIKPDDNLVGRLEYLGRFFKGAFTLNSFYELGTGLEVKNEFVYLEVQPGQGAYTWTDYNNNGIKELDEFEVAVFTDQANYIKVFTPTNQYIKAYASQFNQIFSIYPAYVWKNYKGLKKFISRFSEQFYFQLSRKTTGAMHEAYNPLNISVADSNLLTINSSLKNILSFNNASTIYGIDYTFSDNKAKTLLINGFDTRTLNTHSAKLRLNLARKYFFNLTSALSKKTFSSEFFTIKNYDIGIKEAEPVLSYQPNTHLRVSFFYKIQYKLNEWSSLREQADLQQTGVEFRYSKLDKGSIIGKVAYIHIKYNAATNTSVAYEMLDALQPGHNMTWNILYQKNLKNNMQLSMIYDGRKPGTSKMIHYGSVQIRAYF